MAPSTCFRVFSWPERFTPFGKCKIRQWRRSGGKRQVIAPGFGLEIKKIRHLFFKMSRMCFLLLKKVQFESVVAVMISTFALRIWLPPWITKISILNLTRWCKCLVSNGCSTSPGSKVKMSSSLPPLNIIIHHKIWAIFDLVSYTDKKPLIC